MKIFRGLFKLCISENSTIEIQSSQGLDLTNALRNCIHYTNCFEHFDLQKLPRKVFVYFDILW